ncbi:RelA/SpoT family protein [Beggiatoa leptomitoformis]|uniref:guanosine-3',5'-bis(diphosphate) 3'-diphosphatase n=1 Tax=Beggiatoa leptomitoformis TaxID=288004 RepID=A0A2N9YAY1_9GAMM|nr:bifunctional (p)ppGpp synthetase/guanosine-3',5'-bis(diphosphate) 3'-pyrophosphohydrolase [Beggiatoa leptomitoformis]ALG67004.1 RelA/SpoT family protein [Beggiatoa leptomitoformis]AUI67623.1 RelA/SpoT family protein [Beggiatoa leptomitoformis]
MSAPCSFINRILISDICTLIEPYLDPLQVREVYHAYLFAAEAHEGQIRQSGEAYIFHPLAVAYILAKLRMDYQTLCAALLHDVVEDTPLTKADITETFSETVADLVDGVTKLTRMPVDSREQAQAASFQKMIIAMNHDLRVIIIKLADRLHNMRTISAMKKRTSQMRIARETLEIYAPIARRLGMDSLYRELQDLSFSALYPYRYRTLMHHLDKLCTKRGELMRSIQTAMEQGFSRQELPAKAYIRERHYYSIYQRMKARKASDIKDNRRKTFLQVTNVATFRIITDNVDSCYRALGVTHGLYKPIEEKFRDYIAVPKINGYQSIHTTQMGPQGIPICVQIRTTDMHEIGERGISAFGLYKLGDNPDHLHDCRQVVRQQANNWLRSLVDMQKNATDSMEFLEHFKMDLFPNEVYVFTPKGKILQLPSGATAIDFAYAVHSNIGDKCIAVKVDGQYASLYAPLISGQTVDILTGEWARPSPTWLNFVVTGRAIARIRRYLKKMQHEEATLIGKRMLDADLASYQLSVDTLNPEQQQHLLSKFKFDTIDTLLTEIGFGNLMSLIVARQFDPAATKEPSSKVLPLSQEEHVEGSNRPLIIKGTEGVIMTFARCCRPIPGDEITGFVSVGKGITIHTKSCKNIAEYKHQYEKWLAVEWDTETEGIFSVDIRLDVPNRPGVLAAISNTLYKLDVNIDQMTSEPRDGLSSIMKLTILVRNRDHLASIMRQLRHLDVVTRVQRIRG